MLIPLAIQLLQPRNLLLAHPGIVDHAHVERMLTVKPIAVDADNHILAAVDSCLAQRRGLLDFELGAAVLHRARHASRSLYLADQRTGTGDEISRKCLNVIAAAERID